MWIIGISKSHNGAVALIKDGKVIVAIQAERISRIKRQAIELKDDKLLIKKCVDYCLNYAGISYSEIESISICTPWDVSYLENSALFSFIGGNPDKYKKTYYVPHHLAHAEYSLHYSNLSPGIVLIVDGSGSKEVDRKKFNLYEDINKNFISHVKSNGKETISAYFFDGKKLTLIYRFSPSANVEDDINSQSYGFLQSIGHYWRWASNYCCGSHSEAGKVMGLAANGNSSTHQNLKILSITEEGLLKVNYVKLYEKFNNPNIFGKDLSFNKHYSDIAAMVQNDTEKTLLDILQFLKKKFPAENLYFSGGVALNVVANEKIINSGLFKEVFLNGSAEDNGTAIGAALAVSNLFTKKRETERVTDYYGINYDNNLILNSIKKFPFKFKLLSEVNKYKKIASLIHSNRIIGWFQSRGEFGPRALGNRSILANPTFRKNKFILDMSVKQRDSYRPYAPVVIEEFKDRYFDIKYNSPVMMSGGKVISKDLPAITHIDGSARIQTLKKSDNKELYKLILAFMEFSGHPVLLNTSFNQPGEPIVESPYDALNSFKNSSMDYLCLGNYLVSRLEN
tara:strand:- start:17847 stop:19547 length:1701 start_codon:yes stop_codon:yes gene_type:complete